MHPTLRQVIIFLFTTLTGLSVSGQTDTLPQVSVKKNQEGIYISWHNTYKNISQINIQRSKDSNKNFITIHSVPDPSVKHYLHMDKTAKTDSGYYRVFILFEGSNYQFSKAKKPVMTAASEVIMPPTSASIPTASNPKPTPAQAANKNPLRDTAQVIKQKPSPEIVKKKNEELPPATPTSPGRRDSVVLKPLTNKLKLINSSYGRILKKGIPPPPVINTSKKWQPSVYIFTGDDGNVTIRIPDAATKNYSVTFLKEEGRPLFNIAKVTSALSTLDKSSFLKSGWYYFELRESNRVIERNKFLITRDY